VESCGGSSHEHRKARLGAPGSLKGVSPITINYVNYNTAQQIKHRVDLIDLISESVQLSRKGRDFWGLCPFHEEKTASFCVSRDWQRFRCWGCGAAGDAIDFIRLRDNVDFRTARDHLAARAGLQAKISPADQRAFRRALEARQAEARRLEWAQKIIKDEWDRMINIEQWCHLFLKHVKTEKDMERPGPVWAAHTISRVEAILDDLERADPTEQLRIALAVRGWRP